MTITLANDFPGALLELSRAVRSCISMCAFDSRAFHLAPLMISILHRAVLGSGPGNASSSAASRIQWLRLQDLWRATLMSGDLRRSRPAQTMLEFAAHFGALHPSPRQYVPRLDLHRVIGITEIGQMPCSLESSGVDNTEQDLWGLLPKRKVGQGVQRCVTDNFTGWLPRHCVTPRSCIALFHNVDHSENTKSLYCRLYLTRAKEI